MFSILKQALGLNVQLQGPTLIARPGSVMATGRSGLPLTTTGLQEVLGPPTEQWDDDYATCFHYSLPGGRVHYYFDSVRVHGESNAFLRTIEFTPTMGSTPSEIA